MASPAETFLDHWLEDYPNWRESESAQDMVRKAEQGLAKIGYGSMPGNTAAEIPAAPADPINPELVLPAERGEIQLFASGAVALPPGKLRRLARTGLLRHAGKGRYDLTDIGRRALA
ncbi:hypothetical protein [Frateuria aurantia]|uniref:Uncharacterized protein n=1 Tax=Frateuria aurantia (strain ATCC 33424 / DSM 6220 / KCTC 2777 / LMG 1558 / NBRC 3245 / NCIMB 13370) TaxID=767434 RepID=H8L1R5_FRAAD|nr:hypothetical protein [Frateuria aurantia]AFC85425.1 hypothetical protein Fraau_0957 [Frateuria aurantia DSM 6220]